MPVNLNQIRPGLDPEMLAQPNSRRHLGGRTKAGPSSYRRFALISANYPSALDPGTANLNGETVNQADRLAPAQCYSGFSGTID
jgi:hypothetical protein